MNGKLEKEDLPNFLDHLYQLTVIQSSLVFGINSQIPLVDNQLHNSQKIEALLIDGSELMNKLMNQLGDTDLDETIKTKVESLSHFLSPLKRKNDLKNESEELCQLRDESRKSNLIEMIESIESDPRSRYKIEPLVQNTVAVTDLRKAEKFFRGGNPLDEIKVIKAIKDALTQAKEDENEHTQIWLYLPGIIEKIKDSMRNKQVQTNYQYYFNLWKSQKDRRSGTAENTTSEPEPVQKKQTKKKPEEEVAFGSNPGQSHSIVQKKRNDKRLPTPPPTTASDHSESKLEYAPEPKPKPKPKSKQVQPLHDK